MREIIGKAIVDLYDAAGPMSISPLTKSGRGLRARLVSRDGIEYFLKGRDVRIDSAQARFYTHLHKFVMDEGGPVPSILSTKSGRLSFHVSNRAFELYQWINGQNVRVSYANELIELSRTLGVFHNIARKFLAGNYGASTVVRYSTWRSTMFESRNLSQIMLRGYSRLGKDGVHEVAEIQRWLAESAPRGRLTLPCQPLHGDADPLNSLRTLDGEIFLTDLEDATYGFRIIDLSNLVASIAGFSVQPDESLRIRRDFNERSAYKLVQGYQDRVSLMDNERRFLSFFIAMAIIRIFTRDLILTPGVPPYDFVTQSYSLLRMVNSLDGLTIT